MLFTDISSAGFFRIEDGSLYEYYYADAGVVAKEEICTLTPNETFELQLDDLTDGKYKAVSIYINGRMIWKKTGSGIKSTVNFGYGTTTSYETVSETGWEDDTSYPFLGTIDINANKYKYYESLLNTCTYSEYEDELVAYGQCSKFAVDIENGKFRVPIIVNKMITDISDKASVIYNMETTNSQKFRYPVVDPKGKLNSLVGGKMDSDNTVGWGPRSTSDTNASTFGLAYFNGTGVKTIDGASISGSWVKMNVDPNGTWLTDLSDAGSSVEVRYFVVVANGQLSPSMMNWSEWASSLQGKANTDLSNCSKPYVVEMSDKSLLPSWYIVWSNGWCEQGGQLAVSTSTTTINLLKSYVGINYNLSMTSSTGYAWISSRTASSFIADISANGNVDWKTCGYIK